MGKTPAGGKIRKTGSANSIFPLLGPNAKSTGKEGRSLLGTIKIHAKKTARKRGLRKTFWPTYKRLHGFRNSKFSYREGAQREKNFGGGTG